MYTGNNQLFYYDPQQDLFHGKLKATDISNLIKEAQQIANKAYMPIKCQRVVSKVWLLISCCMFVVGNVFTFSNVEDLNWYFYFGLSNIILSILSGVVWPFIACLVSKKRTRKKMNRALAVFCQNKNKTLQSKKIKLRPGFDAIWFEIIDLDPFNTLVEEDSEDSSQEVQLSHNYQQLQRSLQGKNYSQIPSIEYESQQKPQSNQTKVQSSEGEYNPT